MNYEFSWGWFFIGCIVMVIGIIFVRYYQVVADNLGGGAGSYERYRLYGVIACLVALIVMLNLHTTMLSWLFGMFIHRS